MFYSGLTGLLICLEIYIGLHQKAKNYPGTERQTKNGLQSPSTLKNDLKRSQYKSVSSYLEKA